MNFKLLGKSGLRVSEIALGGMTIGNSWGWGAEKDESKAIFNAYVDMGGNFIDTACNYQDGKSEEFIGEFIEGDRDSYVIATKYTLQDFKSKDDPNSGGNHRKNLIRTINGSLNRLGTKYIDVLYLHMWDYTTGLEEIIRTLNDLVSSTKINYIAVSDTPAWIISAANAMAQVRGWEPFVAVQFPYNLAYRHAERGIIPMANQFDLAMTTWRVLRGGLLSGKYSRDELKSENSMDGITPERLELSKKVDEVADKLGVSSAQVAIRWVMQQKGVIIPILGATKKFQMEDNLGALNITIDKENMEILSNISNFEIGFPYDFFDDEVKDLIFGNTYSKLLNHHNRYE